MLAYDVLMNERERKNSKAMARGDFDSLDDVGVSTMTEMFDKLGAKRS